MRPRTSAVVVTARLGVSVLVRAMPVSPVRPTLAVTRYVPVVPLAVAVTLA